MLIDANRIPDPPLRRHPTGKRRKSGSPSSNGTVSTNDFTSGSTAAITSSGPVTLNDQYPSSRVTTAASIRSLDEPESASGGRVGMT